MSQMHSSMFKREQDLALGVLSSGLMEVLGVLIRFSGGA
jgi:hypothetical protein